MEGWPTGKENYIFEKVTENHKPLVKTFWCLDEALCLEDTQAWQFWKFWKKYKQVNGVHSTRSSKELPAGAFGFVLCGVGDWTLSFMHPREVLHHWATYIPGPDLFELDHQE